MRVGPMTPLLLLVVSAGFSGCSSKSNDGVQVEFVLALADGNYTPFGTFIVETDAEHTPKTVANFLRYVDSEFYVDLTIHRVNPAFIVEGGGLEADYRTRHPARAPIPLEATVEKPNLQWTVGMSRTSSTAPDSATSGFFVNLEDNPSLDPSGPGTGYAVFAHVVSGFETFELMTTVERGAPYNAGGFYPKTPIVIVSAERV